MTYMCVRYYTYTSCKNTHQNNKAIVPQHQHYHIAGLRLYYTVRVTAGHEQPRGGRQRGSLRG